MLAVPKGLGGGGGGEWSVQDPAWMDLNLDRSTVIRPGPTPSDYSLQLACTNIQNSNVNAVANENLRLFERNYGCSHYCVIHCNGEQETRSLGTGYSKLKRACSVARVFAGR